MRGIDTAEDKLYSEQFAVSRGMNIGLYSYRYSRYAAHISAVGEAHNNRRGKV
jgi:hypothetical protein